MRLVFLALFVAGLKGLTAAQGDPEEASPSVHGFLSALYIFGQAFVPLRSAVEELLSSPSRTASDTIAGFRALGRELLARDHGERAKGLHDEGSVERAEPRRRILSRDLRWEEEKARAEAATSADVFATAASLDEARFVTAIATRKLSAPSSVPVFGPRVGSLFPVFLDGELPAALKYSDQVAALLNDIERAHPNSTRNSGWDGSNINTIPPVFFARCSGVGIFIPSSPSLGPSSSFSCNNRALSAADYTAITALQAAGLNSTATTAQLLPVLAVANLTGLFRANSPLFFSRPLPFNGSSLSLAQRTALAATLNAPNVTAATIATLTSANANVSFFVSASDSDINRNIGVLMLIGAQNTALIIAPGSDGGGINCMTAVEPPAFANLSRFDVPGTCACPDDFVGDECEVPKHYSCAVTHADPLYHVCSAMGGKGFQPPAANEWDSGLAKVAEPSFLEEQRGNDALFANLHRLFGGSSALSNSYATNPLTSAREAPFSAGSQPSEGNVDPRCLFFRRQSSRQTMKLRLHVRCGPHVSSNVSASLTSASVLAAGNGQPYSVFTALADAAAAVPSSASAMGFISMSSASSTAGVALSYSPPVLLPAIEAVPLFNSYHCNGSTVSAAAAANNPLSFAGCVEAAFARPRAWAKNSSNNTSRSASYASVARAISSAGTKRPFRLTVPPPLPLALRLRAVSPTYLSDASSFSLAIIPVTALDGADQEGATIEASLDLSRLAADGDYWPGGRIVIEASVVMLPEPPFSDDTLTAAGYSNLQSLQSGERRSRGDTSATPLYRPSDLALLLQPHFPSRWWTVADALANQANTSSASAASLLNQTLSFRLNQQHRDESDWRDSGVASYRLAPRPRLILSGVTSFSVDDPSWSPPTNAAAVNQSRLTAGLVLGLGLPALLVGIAVWLYSRRRRSIRAAKEREAVQDRMAVQQGQQSH